MIAFIVVSIIAMIILFWQMHKWKYDFLHDKYERLDIMGQLPQARIASIGAHLPGPHHLIAESQHNSVQNVVPVIQGGTVQGMGQQQPATSTQPLASQANPNNYQRKINQGNSAHISQTTLPRRSKVTQNKASKSHENSERTLGEQHFANQSYQNRGGMGTVQQPSNNPQTQFIPSQAFRSQVDTDPNIRAAGDQRNIPQTTSIPYVPPVAQQNTWQPNAQNGILRGASLKYESVPGTTGQARYVGNSGTGVPLQPKAAQRLGQQSVPAQNVGPSFQMQGVAPQQYTQPINHSQGFYTQSQNAGTTTQGYHKQHLTQQEVYPWDSISQVPSPSSSIGISNPYQAAGNYKWEIHSPVSSVPPPVNAPQKTRVA